MPRRRGLRTSARVGVKGRGGQATRAHGQSEDVPFTAMNAAGKFQKKTPAIEDDIRILDIELKDSRLAIDF